MCVHLYRVIKFSLEIRFPAITFRDDLFLSHEAVLLMYVDLELVPKILY